MMLDLAGQLLSCWPDTWFWNTHLQAIACKGKVDV